MKVVDVDAPLPETVERWTYVLPPDESPVVPGIHLKQELADDDRPIPLPLCWIAEGQQRGATVEHWLISVDHDALPDVLMTETRELVDCRECQEWMHA